MDYMFANILTAFLWAIAVGCNVWLTYKLCKLVRHFEDAVVLSQYQSVGRFSELKFSRKTDAPPTATQN